MGRTKTGSGVIPLFDVQKPDHSMKWAEGASSDDGRVFGTYVHGLFDAPAFRRLFLNRLRARRGWDPLEIQAERSLDQTLDDWADFVAQHVDLPAIEAIIEQGV
jgi:adenosylcobyric acid synthase